MKYYEQLLKWRCFTKGDIAQLTGNKNTAGSLISSYKKKGLIESVHRDLFVAISLETRRPIASRFNIAAKAAPDAVVSHHSAFEFYGLANQICFEAYSATHTHFRPFEYQSVLFRPVPAGIESGVDEIGGIRVTDMERTVLDGINDFERNCGLEELLRALELTPALDAEKLLKYLSEYRTVYLYQKAGYILDHFREEFRLPEKFFEACRANVTESKRCLCKGVQKREHVYSEQWRLYAPYDLYEITSKGSLPDREI
ncbi:MAG: transcriptional regulator [Clostridiales bacterium]|nr:transcriptional regulator [Clostridiales bacterium]